MRTPDFRQTCRKPGYGARTVIDGPGFRIVAASDYWSRLTSLKSASTTFSSAGCASDAPAASAPCWEAACACLSAYIFSPSFCDSPAKASPLAWIPPRSDKRGGGKECGNQG